MRFDWPLGLLALLLVPLVVLAYLAIERRRARYAIHYTNIEVLASVAGRSHAVALVRPAARRAPGSDLRPRRHRPARAPDAVASEQASIALTVDTSGSMAADDVKPTRLGAAEGAIRRFLDEIPKKYRVGLVTFSSEPFVVSPLTFDRQRCCRRCSTTSSRAREPRSATRSPARSSSFSRSPRTATRAGGPTAPTGDPDKPLSAILLLSDGAQTRGTLQPLQGAARAKSYGIPIYAVALGTPNGTSTGAGSRDRCRPIRPRCARSRSPRAASSSRPRTRRTSTPSTSDLASRLGRKNEWREVSYVLVGLAALLALCAGGLSLLWNPRLP